MLSATRAGSSPTSTENRPEPARGRSVHRRLTRPFPFQKTPKSTPNLYITVLCITIPSGAPLELNWNFGHVLSSRMFRRCAAGGPHPQLVRYTRRFHHQRCCPPPTEQSRQSSVFDPNFLSPRNGPHTAAALAPPLSSLPASGTQQLSTHNFAGHPEMA